MSGPEKVNRRTMTYHVGEFARWRALVVVGEDSHIVSHRLKDGLRTSLTGCWRRQYFSCCCWDFGKCLVPHADHNVSRIPTPKHRRGIVPILVRKFRRVNREAEHIPRLTDDSTHDRILNVGVWPKIYSHAAWWLSHEDDLSPISTESFDIITDPFHCHTLILESQVLALTWCTRKSKNVKAEVHCDDNHVLSIGKVLSVVEWRVCSPDWVPASVEENNHRFRRLRRLLAPYIQVQTILALGISVLIREICYDSEFLRCRQWVCHRLRGGLGAVIRLEEISTSIIQNAVCPVTQLAASWTIVWFWHSSSCGGANRRFPTGDCAYGRPKYSKTVDLFVASCPFTIPFCVRTYCWEGIEAAKMVWMSSNCRNREFCIAAFR